MIRAELAAFQESADPFAEGLSAWFRGDETPRAEAAGILFADTVRAIHAFLTKE
jgi:hypothetical protein